MRRAGGEDSDPVAAPGRSAPQASLELTHEVLLRVAEFLRRLPADQLKDLADGSARLAVVPRPLRPVLPRPSDPPQLDLPRPVDEIKTTLVDFEERARASAYLDEMKLTVAQLRSLAAALGIAVPSKATKAQTRDTIVQWTVGRRSDTQIIGRPAPRADQPARPRLVG